VTDAGAIIDSCAISPNGQFLALVLRTGVMRLWDQSIGAAREDMTPSDPATAVAFSPDGGSTLVGHASGAVTFVRWISI
jgi:hypothetical protein